MAEMDYAGVDLGVLHTYPTMGHPTHLNAYLRDITTRFPDRFRRTVYLREASIPDDPEAAIKALDRELAAGGVVGYQFIPGYYYNPSGGVEVGRDEPWDERPHAPLLGRPRGAQRARLFHVDRGDGGKDLPGFLDRRIYRRAAHHDPLDGALSSSDYDDHARLALDALHARRQDSLP